MTYFHARLTLMVIFSFLTFSCASTFDGASSTTNESQQLSDNVVATPNEEIDEGDFEFNPDNVVGAAAHLWTLSSGAQTWSPTAVKLGNQSKDALVFYRPTFNSPQAYLEVLPTTNATNPPTAAARLVLPQADYVSLASARDVRSHAVVYQYLSGSQRLMAMKWMINLSTPMHFDFPTSWFSGTFSKPFGAFMSPDGQTLIVWANPGSSITVYVFRNGSLVNPSIYTYAGIASSGARHLANYAVDSGTLVISAGTRTLVANMNNGQQIGSSFVNWDADASPDPAISDAGDVFVRAIDTYNSTTGVYAGGFKVYRRQSNGTYLESVATVVDNQAGGVAGMQITRDGKTLAIYEGVWNTSVMTHGKVNFYDLSGAQPLLLQSDPVTSDGVYNNVCINMEFSADGKMLAVSCTGTGTTPNVITYNRDPLNPTTGQFLRQFEYTFAGSVMDAAFSDGKLLTYSRSTHYSEAHLPEDRFDLFELGQAPIADELTLQGTFSPGTTVSFKLTGGTPNKYGWLLVAPSLITPPVIYGDVDGLLYLNPTTLAMAGRDRFDANGEITFTYLVPNNLIPGQRLFFQGLIHRIEGRWSNFLMAEVVQ